MKLNYNFFFPLLFLLAWGCTSADDSERTNYFISKSDFFNILDSSSEIFMDANPKRNRPEGNRIILNSKQKEELSKHFANLEKKDKKMVFKTPTAGLPIDFLICTIIFYKKDHIVAKINYHSPGLIEIPDRAVWQSSKPQDFDNFIKSLKFRFPMLGTKKYAGDS